MPVLNDNYLPYRAGIKLSTLSSEGRDFTNSTKHAHPCVQRTITCFSLCAEADNEIQINTGTN